MIAIVRIWCAKLRTTLSVLALDNNRFQVLSGMAFEEHARVLAYNNLLSCHLPTCGNVSTKLSLAALGNQIWRPEKDFPAWVSVLERDSLLWSSDTEGSRVERRSTYHWELEDYISSIYFQGIISRNYFILVYIEKFWPNYFS